MSRLVYIGEDTYDYSALTREAQNLVDSYNVADEKLKTALRLSVLLKRAKAGFIQDLKQEVIKARTGIDLV